MRATRSAVAAAKSPEPPAAATFRQSLQRFQYESGTMSPPAIVSRQSSPLKRKEGPESTKSPTPAKKRRESSKYAPPSKYAHLSGLIDILEDDLIAVFVGFNPGVRTATTGHAYAHPSNLFWKLLHSSGLTDRRWRPEEDQKLPTIGLGSTNLVSRPTKDAGELSKSERAAGAPILEAKVRKYKPEAVCIVGKSIWEDIWRYRYGRNPKPAEFKYGWQEEKENLGKIEETDDASKKSWNGAKVFVTTSTSGLSASLKPAEKEAIWLPFGQWVQQRRLQRVSSTNPENTADLSTQQLKV